MPNLGTSYIFKDSQGFIWISTLKGLCRYDGYNVKIFKQDKNNPASIGGTAAGFICEDKEGNIWSTQTNGSISKYNKSKNTFTSYTHYLNSKNDSIKFIYGKVICSANNDIIYGDISGYNNALYNKKANCFKVISVDTTNDGYNHKQASNQLVGVVMQVNNSSGLYLLSANGLFSYDIKTGIKKRITKSSLYTPLDLYKDNNGLLWLGEWDGGLSIIDPTTGKIKNIVPNKTIGNIAAYKDGNGKAWIVASEYKTGSILIVDPVTKKYFLQVIKTTDQVTPNLLAGEILNAENGKLLFTSANGVYEMNEGNAAITNVFTYKIGAPIDIYYDNLIRSCVQLPNGDFIFGKLGGNGILIYDSSLQLKKEIKNYTYNGKIYDLDVRSFLKINDNKYLLTGALGAAYYENGNLIPLSYVSKKEINTAGVINTIRNALPIDTDNYWLRLTANGIAQYNTHTKSITNTFTKAKDNISLETIFDIKYDAKGVLWATSYFNIFKFNNISKQFEAQPINVNRNPITHMRKCCFDAQQNLWITGLGGLLHYDFNTKKETIYTTENGLSDDDVYSILPYDDNSIIITQATCITHFNYTTKTFTSINNKNGMPYSTNEYDAALLLDNNKNLIIGNSGVITKINIPKYLSNENLKSSIVITQIEGSNTDEEIFLDGNIKKVNLNFKNFPINILFSLINYNATEEISYYYRYLGKDSTWLKCNNGIVPVNTITPGTYTIEVSASIDGKIVSAKDSITFTIVPRWFETLLFKIIAWLLAIIAFILLFRWRINTVKKSQAQETEIQRLAAQEYKNQLELNQISNYFSTSLIHLETEEEVLWDVAKNLIGTLGFEDCIIYLWNKDKTKLVQRAGFGPKGSIEEINKLPFDVVLGQGVVGNVAMQKVSVLINDTRQDTRYRVDEMQRLSEICVPILHNNELIGIIDSEHSTANFYTQKHLQSLTTIAAHLSNKLEEIKSKQAIKKNSEELQKTLDLLKGAQLEALRSQMNPHFIFNCLNSIKLYTTQNDTIAASNYLTKFSKLIRMALENSRSETITLAAELEALELYIEMEAMRFKEKLKYSIHINDNVDSEFIEISPLLLQPYVENAIWHGLMHKEDGGFINIHVGIVPQKQILVISIKDNGVGREKSAALKSKTAMAHKSFGTKVTGERLDLINQIYNTGASVHTEDVLENGIVAGTLVTISIPFE